MKYRNYYCTPKFSDGEKMYYGDVEGVPEIAMIEAENLDDFERLFKEEYLGFDHPMFLCERAKMDRVVEIFKKLRDNIPELKKFQEEEAL